MLILNVFFIYLIVLPIFYLTTLTVVSGTFMGKYVVSSL